MKKIIAAIVLIATVSAPVLTPAANAQPRAQHSHGYRPAPVIHTPYRYGYAAPRIIITTGYPYSYYSYPYAYGYGYNYGYVAPVVAATYGVPVTSNAAGGAIIGGVLGSIIGRSTGGYRNGWAGALIGTTIGAMAGAAADNAAINNQRAAAAQQQQTASYDYAPAQAAQQPQPAPLQTPAQQQPTIINNYYGPAAGTPNTPMGQANGLFGRQ